MGKWVRVFLDIDPRELHTMFLQTPIPQMVIKDHIKKMNSRPKLYHCYNVKEIPQGTQVAVDESVKQAYHIEDFQKEIEASLGGETDKRQEDRVLDSLFVPTVWDTFEHDAVTSIFIVGYYAWKRNEAHKHHLQMPYGVVLNYQFIQLWYHTGTHSWAATDCREEKQRPTNTPWNIVFDQFVNLQYPNMHLHGTKPHIERNSSFEKQSIQNGSHRQFAQHPAFRSTQYMPDPLIYSSRFTNPTNVATSPSEGGAKGGGDDYLVGRISSYVRDASEDILIYTIKKTLEQRRDLQNSEHKVFTTDSKDLKRRGDNKFAWYVDSGIHGDVYISPMSTTLDQEMEYRSRTKDVLSQATAENRAREIGNNPGTVIPIGDGQVDMDHCSINSKHTELLIGEGRVFATTSEARHLLSPNDHTQQMRDQYSRILYLLQSAPMEFGIPSGTERSGSSNRVAEQGISRVENFRKRMRTLIERPMICCSTIVIGNMQKYVRYTHRLVEHELNTIKPMLTTDAVLRLTSAFYDIPMSFLDQRSVENQQALLLTDASKPQGTPSTGILSTTTSTEKRRKQSSNEKVTRAQKRAREPAT